MADVGILRYIDFRIVDVQNNPVPGRQLTDWVIIHTRNNAPVSDPLSLLDHTDGRYTITYTPSSVGHEYFDLYDALHDIRIVDIEAIQESLQEQLASDVIDLNHDFGGTDALRILDPGPEQYDLFVFHSADWLTYQREDVSAVGHTRLGSDGRWLDPVPVLAGTYHVVIRKTGLHKIVAINLAVS